MISVLLSYSEEARAKAVKDGFKEQTVLVKFEPFHADGKGRREMEIMRAIAPNRFFVGDFWGAGPD